MGHIVRGVDLGSVGEQLGICVGDEVVSINGERIVDWVDYQALCCNEQMVVVVEREGEQVEFEFEKDEYEPLGLSFDAELMSAIRNCCNDCIFCFVDQLPVGTRETMHVKDDDWRTSLLMGSFVTLTNVGEAELDRIIRRHATPLYISVHATDDEVREFMLGTPRGAGIMKQLKRLADGGIEFHAQAVLCPELNDGEILEQTIADLASLYPAAQSLALVPVGLTGHRGGLCPIEPFDWHRANDVMDIVGRWRKKLLGEIGTRFVHAADEFYLLAGRQFPPDEAYEDYPQIDNGVGLCRMLETEFHEAYEEAESLKVQPRNLVIACGVSVAPFMDALMKSHPISGVHISVRPIVNNFFGSSVTVSGLITGRDLVSQLQGVKADKILITVCMLRDDQDEEVFLDDMLLSDAEKALGVPIVPVGRRGDELLGALLSD